MYIGRIK